MTCSSVEAQYLPSRNSMTKAGTPKALRMRRRRSFRTTRPGKASVASWSSSSSSNVRSVMRCSHVSPDDQFDPARWKLLGRLHVTDVEVQELSLRERRSGVEEERD